MDMITTKDKELQPSKALMVRKNNEQGIGGSGSTSGLMIMKNMAESNGVSRCSLNRSNCGGSGLDETLKAVKNLLSFKKSESSNNLIKITRPSKKEAA
jgi:hypothetical protein